MYKVFKDFKLFFAMKCKYCKEKDESKLLMRTSAAEGIAETINICTSCLWQRVLEQKIQDGNLLSKKASIEERLLDRSQPTHSRVGKKAR
ncbi:MAG: hypothetical protein JRF64_00970 [Deltaproteobacteria bacterium]|nr:hypothetical protein [Deltaproteobacteria bacterium]